MSLTLEARGSGGALQSGNFFLDLPEDVLKVILGYIKPEEGVQLIGTQRALKRRLTEILRENQINYLSCLCKKVSDCFLFTTEEYRNEVAKKGQEFLDKGIELLTLTSLNEESKVLGMEIFPFLDDSFEEYFQLCFRSEGRRESFFNHFQERVSEALIKIGIELVGKQGRLRDVIELTEKGEGGDEQRALYIEISLSLKENIEGERDFHLINTIKNEKQKEKIMNIWVRQVNRNDPFLETEEFLDKITPIPLVTHLVLTGKRGNCLLALFDKTIRHPNKLVRKDVLFQFFRYWCKHGRGFEEPFIGELNSKFIALMETFPEAERNIGVFGVLKGAIFSNCFFKGEGDFHNYTAYGLLYLADLIDREGGAPVQILEAYPQITKQISEHRQFFNSFSLSTPYYVDYTNDIWISFFEAAMERAQEESEIVSVLEEAQKQLASYTKEERAFLVRGILSSSVTHQPNIRAMILKRIR